MKFNDVESLTWHWMQECDGVWTVAYDTAFIDVEFQPSYRDHNWS